MRVVLPFASGLVLAAFVVLAGLLGTPFFGSSAGYWANVLGAFLLALAIGIGLGDRVSALAGSAERAPARLTVLGGALVTAAFWALPRVARLFLDYAPDSPWSASGFAVAIVALPGCIVAAAVGGQGRADDDPGEKTSRFEAQLIVVRRAQRRFALAMLGAVIGTGLLLAALRHPGVAARLPLLCFGLGVGLLATGAVAAAMPGRAAAAVFSVALASLFVVSPSEVQDELFLEALSEATAAPGAGRYYATSPRTPAHVLKGTEVARKVADAERRLGGRDREIAVLLTIETLKRLGAANISGEGLRQTLDLYLPTMSKAMVTPMLDKVALIKCDGRDTFTISVKKDPGGDVTRVAIPGADGKVQKFLIKSDFTLSLREERRSTETISYLDIGPQVIEKGIINDTHCTPVLCEDAALFLDAYLLGIDVENKTDQVIVRARAQAKIGGVQSAILQIVDKLALKRAAEAAEQGKR